MPAYLESFFPKQVVDQAQSTQNSSFLRTSSESFLNSKKKSFSQKSLFENSSVFNKSISKVLDNSPLSSISEKADTGEFQNQFYKLKTKFYQNWLQLQNQLKIVFLEKQFLVSIPELENKKNEKSLNSKGYVDSIFLDTFCTHFFQNNDEITETEFLKILEQLQISSESLKPRNMSGYRYPDMTTSQVKRFLLQKYFFGEKNSFVKIPLNNLGFQNQKELVSSGGLNKPTDFKLISQIDYQFLPKTSLARAF